MLETMNRINRAENNYFGGVFLWFFVCQIQAMLDGFLHHGLDELH